MSVACIAPVFRFKFISIVTYYFKHHVNFIVLKQMTLPDTYMIQPYLCYTDTIPCNMAMSRLSLAIVSPDVYFTLQIAIDSDFHACSPFTDLFAKNCYLVLYHNLQHLSTLCKLLAIFHQLIYHY